MSASEKLLTLASLVRGTPDTRTPKDRLQDEVISSLRREVAALEAQIAGEQGKGAIADGH